MIESLADITSEVNPNNIGVMCSLAVNTPPGALVEIGVYRGGTALHLSAISKLQNRELYLYDTFTGMPFWDPEIDTIPAGEFVDTDLAGLKRLFPEAHFIQGVFPESLIEMPPVAFVHADCDQYQSVKAVIDEMPKRMVEGGLIYFDDYGALESATKAVNDSGKPFEVLHNGKAIMRIQ